MRALQDRLDDLRTAFQKKAAEGAQAIMARATKDLANSGILSRIPSPGDTLIPFELPDTEGIIVRSSALLDGGPIVVAVYRGVW